MENKTTVNTDIGVEIQNVVELEGIEKVLAAAGDQQADALKTIAAVGAAEVVQAQKNFENVRDLGLLVGVGFLIWKGIS